MQVNLTNEQVNELIRSLEYTKRSYEACTEYPSYEFKCARIAEVQAIISEVRRARREAKEAAHAS